MHVEKEIHAFSVPAESAKFYRFRVFSRLGRVSQKSPPLAILHTWRRHFQNFRQATPAILVALIWKTIYRQKSRRKHTRPATGSCLHSTVRACFRSSGWFQRHLWHFSKSVKRHDVREERRSKDSGCQVFPSKSRNRPLTIHSL